MQYTAMVKSLIFKTVCRLNNSLYHGHAPTNTLQPVCIVLSAQK